MEKTRRKEDSFSHALPTDRDANSPDIVVNGDSAQLALAVGWRVVEEEVGYRHTLLANN